MSTSSITIKRTCQWCGSEFDAQKLTTRFCCKKCRDKAYKKGLRESQIKGATKTIELKTPMPQDKEYLSAAEAAKLLGVTRMTVYNMIYQKKLYASKISSRMTIIRRCDIDTMILRSTYTKNAILDSQDPITEFYTTREIMEKYGVSESWIFILGKEKKIPRTKKMGKTYWSKKHIDKYIIKDQPDESITEWYSVSELMEKFNMTKVAVYSFVSERQIPKKKIQRECFYSKTHVDIAKGIKEPEKPEYYTMQEAMEKFHMSRDQIYHYTKAYSITKTMDGKYVKYSKKELDILFAGPMIINTNK